MGFKVAGLQGCKVAGFRVAPRAVALLIVCLSVMAARRPLSPAVFEAAPKAALSEYGLFSGPLADLSPAANVFPYEVNAPLFSDYAEKARFIYLPEGARMVYRDSTAFEFPEGAVIIKNFYYHHDATKPEKGRRILETRLLIREAKGWKALE